MVNKKKANFPLDPLVEVMDKLLSSEGCPWDRKQNHATLLKGIYLKKHMKL